MKYPLLALLLIAAITLAPGSVQAQTTAPGPYYATPSWDQTIACTTTANCPRFIVLSNMNNEAVLDRETGLVWDRGYYWYEGPVPWNTALSRCIHLYLGNRNGWRLPTIQELASLIDPSLRTLPPGHPFVPNLGITWSATTVVNDPTRAWGVNFHNGYISDDDKGRSFNRWCVRGGKGVDPQ